MLQNRYFLLLAFFAFQCISAQVKIGSNPNTIDPGSIIELESNNKALVLTRLTNTQMVGLTPLRGALVFNTDTQCVHFYDSTQWVNLCSAANSTGFSFTDNGDGTITLANDSGGTVTFDGAPETISTLVDNSDGTYTYTNENGTQTIISSSSNVNLNTDGTAGNIGVANGNTITLNVDDADADNQNEIQSLQFSGGVISLTNDPDATIIDLSGFDDDVSDDFSGAFGDLTDIPTNLAAVIANTSGINTGDQDISGIAINATDIDALEAEQIVQNDAIAINTAKTGITTAQADIIANTSGINTGDQDISGIANKRNGHRCAGSGTNRTERCHRHQHRKNRYHDSSSGHHREHFRSEHGRSGYFGNCNKRNEHCDKYDRHRCARSGTDRTERCHRHQHRKNGDHDSTGGYHREHLRE